MISALVGTSAWIMPPPEGAELVIGCAAAPCGVVLGWATADVSPLMTARRVCASLVASAFFSCHHMNIAVRVGCAVQLAPPVP